MPRNLYRRKGTWYAKIQKDGQAIRRSLETRELGAAKERLEVLRREITGDRWGERRRYTFDDAAQRFASEHFPHLKPSSRTRYALSLIALADHFHRVPLADIGSAKLLEFETARRTQVTPATVRRDLACLSSLLSRCEEWEWMTANPVKPFLRSRKRYGLTEGEARTRYPSHEEEAKILALAPPKAARAIAFAIDTGLRKEEQFSLLRSDVDLEAGELNVRAEIAKNGKARRVPLLPRARALADQLMQGPGQYLFQTAAGARYSKSSPTMYEALQKACRRAGIKAHLEWHDLRRGCGCRLLQDYRMSFEEVSAWLGHSDVRITQARYAFLETRQLHEAVSRAGNVVVLRLVPGSVPVTASYLFLGTAPLRGTFGLFGSASVSGVPTCAGTPFTRSMSICSYARMDRSRFANWITFAILAS